MEKWYVSEIVRMINDCEAIKDLGVSRYAEEQAEVDCYRKIRELLNEYLDKSD